jgi:hypothetical protein
MAGSSHAEYGYDSPRTQEVVVLHIQELRSRLQSGVGQTLVGVLVALLVSPGNALARSQDPAAAPAAAEAPEQAPALSMDQLKSLVAPIALYPDPLLAQCLAASTYPLDIMEAQQWLSSNASLKGDALTEAAQKQDWDPSVQALVVLPDALKRLSEDIKWTTDLGNAFLAQEQDVMNAVQALRNEARSAGKLESSEQQTVETKVVETKTIVEIQPASTQVVYVPSYSPTVIWGPPVYPYPPVYYPPYVPGAALFSFGMGMAVGAAIGGGWGWGCGWGGSHTTININNNNSFNRNTNVNRNVSRSGNSTWQHNAQNRGGVPYKDKATANKYGGGARGDSASARQSQARSRQGDSVQRGSNSAMSNRSGGAGTSSRAGGGDFNRGGGGGSSVGNRSVPQTNRSGGSAFGGGGGSSSGSRAHASSSRGSSSMGSRGGGAHRGGGGGGRRR